MRSRQSLFAIALSFWQRRLAKTVRMAWSVGTAGLTVYRIDACLAQLGMTATDDLFVCASDRGGSRPILRKSLCVSA